jgi:hypothetical protein
LPTGLSADQLKTLVRHGAASRIAELEAEIALIRRSFPDVTPRRRKINEADGSVRKRRRRKMSAAARRAVGERMKKYWAARRAQAKK